MAQEQAEGVVVAVVVYDGRVLLVRSGSGWELPSGGPEPAETPEATAARVVHERTGYLVDGSATLDGPPAVVCQLLSEEPSEAAGPTPERARWTPIEETAGTPMPTAVRDYLRGHTPA
ncbi:NUDIX hydrolase [Streptomyces sp. AF1A]|jgi:8-oxo-dGTP pyrophosphatase MutT (NUDIX family)|uniref:NUDIX hydrolase n=1 Tax=Streptomyces sp. AF1A TaxID=3394350 RepID=UPI0039BD763C